MASVGHQESPAQHRFPVWWTGDGVPLQGSVESMVDSGVHDFKPYVHSDCGGTPPSRWHAASTFVFFWFAEPQLPCAQNRGWLAAEARTTLTHPLPPTKATHTLLTAPLLLRAP